MNSNAGVFIDIDGVVLHGGKPFEWSKDAIHSLWNNEIPFVFVTNGTYSSANLINTLTNILDLPFTNDHIVVAPSPCSMLTQYHNKHVLVCCQDSSIGLIPELGFQSFVTVPQIAEIFLELDFVDHNKRKQLLQTPFTAERQRLMDEFKPIEAILLLGEPINWESALQIIIDLMMTNGDPRNTFKFVPYPHLPIIVCNKDLTFKGAAALPRFGHGAFLACLESLYAKITRNELVYDQIMGKPYLVTYEYASSKIQRLAKPEQVINKFYIIGDNPDVDIRGANLFKEHLLKSESQIKKKRTSLYGTNLSSTEFVESILVCTGVYNPLNDINYHLDNLFNDQNNNNTLVDANNNNDEAEDLNVPVKIFYMNPSNSNSTNVLKKNESILSLCEHEKNQLKKAMSRRNSFIDYFGNYYNNPDITVDNFMSAVEHIIKNTVLNKFKQ